MMEKAPYERPTIRKLNGGHLNKFGAMQHAPMTDIEGVPVQKLIATFGSPLFVLSERVIRQTYQDALQAFKTRYPKVQFAWSYKTNYLDAVCQIFHQEGSWAEVVSGFEYQKALNNGVAGHHILFNGPDKSEADLQLAIANGSMIHIDHADEFYLLRSLVANSDIKVNVAIRVNMDTGVFPIWDRFGFNFENGQAWSMLEKIMDEPRMHLVGLHCHIGTYMLTANAYAVAAEKLSQLAFKIKEKYQHGLQYLDLGGGFASANSLKGAYLPAVDVIPSMDDYAEAITNTLLNAGFKNAELPLLILETGRALIDDAGYLLGTVLANKMLSDGKKALVVDFGVNLLITALWYDHKISPVSTHSAQSENTAIFGPLCMNIDCIREHINLPLLSKGEHVVAHRVGAYNMTQWMQFIQMRPNIVLIDQKGTPHLIREKEQLQTLTQLEHLPQHLKNA